MTDAKKLVILKRLTDHLKTIVPDADHDFDLSSGVYRGKQQFGEEAPLPALSILENPRPDHGLLGGEHGIAYKEDWVLLLQGWVKDDHENPTDPAYNLMAAVEKKLSELIDIDDNGEPLYPSVYLLGGLIVELRVGPGVCRPPQEGLSSKAFFFLPLTLTLSYSIAEPYAL